MSTIGFIAHALRPSTTSTNIKHQHQNKPGNSPQTVTGNRYSIFTTKNYGDSEMHWFWMVLICALLLFDWWKLRRYCKCPGLSKQERKDKRQARWNKRQLEEIEEKINRYERKRKLEDIRSLRNSLGERTPALSDTRALWSRTQKIGGIHGQ